MALQFRCLWISQTRVMAAKAKGRFIDPMLLLRADTLPDDGKQPVRYAAPLDASLRVLVESVKAQGLEGLIAKRLDRRYEPGLRTGAWQKMRVNRAAIVSSRWLEPPQRPAATGGHESPAGRASVSSLRQGLSS